MRYALLVLIMISPLMWLISVRLLRNWQYFWRYFLCNLLLLIGYAYIVLAVLPFPNDAYGLARLFAVLVAIAVHTLLGFGLALAVRYGRRTSL